MGSGSRFGCGFFRHRRYSSLCMDFLAPLPFPPILFPLVRVPIILFAIAEDVGVDERARAAAFGRDFVGALVQLECERQRRRRGPRRFAPLIVAEAFAVLFAI